MAIIPNDLPGLVAQLSALVNASRDNVPTPAIEELAEKILWATRPVLPDPMLRMYNYVEIVVLRLFIDWEVFENIPLEGTISYAQLAKKVDADESLLRRYAWALVARRILRQQGEDDIAHTEVSKVYLPGRPERNMFTFYYDEMFSTCVKMPAFYSHYGRHEPRSQNHTPYSFGHGQPEKTLWEICHQQPERLNRVMEAMDTAQHGPTLAGSYDFTWLRGKISSEQHRDRILFVDVGGGKGHITKAVLQQNLFIPHGRAVLEDREEVIQQVMSNRDPGLSDVKLQAHNFHDKQPIENALVYFICRCLHNYSDDVSANILTRLSNAMAPDSKVLIAETVMDNPPMAMQSMFDFTMINIGGKERTLKGWTELAARAGLKVENVYGRGQFIQIIECVKY
ncbi:o-methyltransferase [Colletotrichum truncatum]|uniref:O-methyltransferase n=1 Tax=Colletotrichum truncatum TaxID=5467 RepID=A0ACC3ZCS7_COLTU|nr:o-methyltransferase [Colletotrichum truncatum]KAF6797892.1 o-methyltransferase [Colletotrichum truncatum]